MLRKSREQQVIILTAQRAGTEGLQAQELVSGLPHSYFINAAFAYFRPRELNRFNGPAREFGTLL